MFYNQKVRESKLKVEEKVLISTLCLKVKFIVCGDWEETQYIVLEVAIGDIPAYRVHQEKGKVPVKTLHRNQLR